MARAAVFLEEVDNNCNHLPTIRVPALAKLHDTESGIGG